jgi:hypothetical protein
MTKFINKINNKKKSQQTKNKNKIRKATYREALPDDVKEEQRRSDRAAHANYREALPDDVKEEQRRRDRAAHANYRAHLKPDSTENIKKRNTLNKALRRAYARAKKGMNKKNSKLCGHQLPPFHLDADSTSFETEQTAHYKKPGTNNNSSFEQDSSAAEKNADEVTGLFRFSEEMRKFQRHHETKDLSQAILQSIPPLETQIELCRSYISKFGGHNDMSACGACGIRLQWDTLHQYSKCVDIDQLEILRLSKEDSELHQADCETNHPRSKVKSVYHFKNAYYHIHPELVIDGCKIHICSSCRRDIYRQIIPKWSIANGVD